MIRYFFHFFAFAVVACPYTSAQFQVKATKVEESPVIDGILEELWQSAEVAESFIQ